MVYKNTGSEWSMLIRDLKWSRNIYSCVGSSSSIVERKSLQDKAIAAYLLYIALKLIRGNNDARDLEFKYV